MFLIMAPNLDNIDVFMIAVCEDCISDFVIKMNKEAESLL